MALAPAPVPSFHTVIFDYGHGGLDPASGAYATEGAKQYTFLRSHLPLAKQVLLRGDKLRINEGVTNRMSIVHSMRHVIESGCRVLDCVAQREWKTAPVPEQLEWRDVSLRERMNYANEHREDAVLISNHSNAVSDVLEGAGLRFRGVDIYTSKGETAADPIATTIHAGLDEILKKTRVRTIGDGDELQARVRIGDWEDGDVDHEENFYVLRKSRMPAVLVEGLFFDNIYDALFLLSARGQYAIGTGIFAGLRPWLKPFPRGVVRGARSPVAVLADASGGRSPGQMAYDAYQAERAAFGELDPWSALMLSERARWEAAADAVLAGLEQGRRV